MAKKEAVSLGGTPATVATVGTSKGGFIIQTATAFLVAIVGGAVDWQNDVVAHFVANVDLYRKVLKAKAFDRMVELAKLISGSKGKRLYRVHQKFPLPEKVVVSPDGTTATLDTLPTVYQSWTAAVLDSAISDATPRIEGETDVAYALRSFIAAMTVAVGANGIGGNFGQLEQRPVKGGYLIGVHSELAAARKLGDDAKGKATASVTAADVLKGMRRPTA